jgi:hypothetical protein
MYGLVYMKTVATFPRTIFFVSVIVVTISLTLLAFVRLPEEEEARSGSVSPSSSGMGDDVEEVADPGRSELEGTVRGAAPG